MVVVRGAGDCFSAGIDIRLLSGEGIEGEESVAELMQAGDEEILDAIDGYQRGFTWLADPRIVSVAAVHGYAIGAGFQLALACDLRVVADDVKFCMKEPALGLVPDLAGTKPLVDLVGYFAGAGDLRHREVRRGRRGPPAGHRHRRRTP